MPTTDYLKSEQIILLQSHVINILIHTDDVVDEE